MRYIDAGHFYIDSYKESIHIVQDDFLEICNWPNCNVEKEGDENMIISAYAGTGKSAFASQIERAVDLTVRPYKWILPSAEKTSVELEKEKGAFHSQGQFRELLIVSERFWRDFQRATGMR